MIRINLLPYRAERRKEAIRLKVAIFLLGVLALGLILFGYNSHLKSNITELDDNIKTTQQELAKYKKILAEIANIKKELGTLKRKIEVIKSLSRNRKEPVVLLEAMSELMIPKRMWLTNFEEKDKNINIAGIALDDKTIAVFLLWALFIGWPICPNLKKSIKKRMNSARFRPNSKMPNGKQKILKNFVMI